MKGKKDCYKKGGEVKEHKKEHEKKHEKKEHEKHEKHEKKEHEEKKEAFKKGGAVHKAGGKMPKMRMDKAMRGKKATPGSPLSGAMPSGLPGNSKSENN